MRFEIDILSSTLKKQVEILVLVARNADVIPAAKLARREGTGTIPDPLWSNIGPDLHEHIDGLGSGFARPGPKRDPVRIPRRSTVPERHSHQPQPLRRQATQLQEQRT